MNYVMEKIRSAFFPLCPQIDKEAQRNDELTHQTLLAIKKNPQKICARIKDCPRHDRPH